MKFEEALILRKKEIKKFDDPATNPYSFDIVKPTEKTTGK
jgi:hypothetical protein